MPPFQDGALGLYATPPNAIFPQVYAVSHAISTVYVYTFSQSRNNVNILMKIWAGAKETIPWAIITALALLNGPSMGRVLYRTIKKGMDRRDRADIKGELQEATFRTILTRLKTQGLIQNESRGIWSLTKKGLLMHKVKDTKDSAYGKFIADHGKQRDTIVIFDIPKHKNNTRDRLRAELIMLGYELLQKSVWIGGGPLPEQFISYLRAAGIMSAVHIFTIQKRGTI